MIRTAMAKNADAKRRATAKTTAAVKGSVAANSSQNFLVLFLIVSLSGTVYPTVPRGVSVTDLTFERFIS